ncbi:hypothetical protein [Brevundimonas sp. Root1423]|nr:hypothetical protein [Brevundimonas sp. Root1423]
MATIKPLSLYSFPRTWSGPGDHAVNGAVRRDEGVAMRQKRHDLFPAT